MEKLRIFIADDERPAREYLKRLLDGIGDIEIVGEAEEGSAALDEIRSLKPDLVLLDLQMPELTGIEVVKALGREQMPLTAFVTAFDEYAIQAFELNAVDYLLKPVEKHRLSETIERARKHLGSAGWREAEAARLSGAVSAYEAATQGEPLERLPVRSGEDIFLVPTSDVISIAADGELLHIVDKNKKRFVINYRLKDLEGKLDSRRFIRVSRSSIVNIEAIKKVSAMPGGTYQLLLEDGQEIAVSRMQSKFLRNKLFKL